jgi:hypothetical protein
LGRREDCGRDRGATYEVVAEEEGERRILGVHELGHLGGHCELVLSRERRRRLQGAKEDHRSSSLPPLSPRARRTGAQRAKALSGTGQLVVGGGEGGAKPEAIESPPLLARLPSAPPISLPPTATYHPAPVADHDEVVVGRCRKEGRTSAVARAEEARASGTGGGARTQRGARHEGTDCQHRAHCEEWVFGTRMEKEEAAKFDSEVRVRGVGMVWGWFVRSDVVAVVSRARAGESDRSW